MKDVAAGLATFGRGEDSVLVHMTPKEVQGLQAIALAHGGSLTINPHTGLPEAGVLKNILPMIAAGVAVATLGPAAGAAVGTGGLFGMSAAGTGAAAGALTGALTNRDNPLQGALMGGLGGYGIGGGMGAAMNSGLFGGAEAAGAGLNALPTEAALGSGQSLAGGGFGANAGIPGGYLTDGLATNNFITPPVDAAGALLTAPQPDTLSAVSGYGTGVGDLQPQPMGLSQSTAQKPSFMQALGQQFPSTGSKVAAGLGAAGMLGAFDQPKLNFAAPQQQASNYRAQRPTQRPYDPTAPGGYYYTDRGILQPAYAAKGGEMHSVPELEDGGFVLTKKAVDGIGKGDNKRGQRAASAGLGAIPIKGPGTGTSDSIPTTIDGKRPALLSNGEAYVPKDQVKRRGGAKKFYALMKQAEREAARRS